MKSHLSYGIYSRVNKRIEIEEKRKQERLRRAKQKEARIRANKKKEINQISRREMYSRVHHVEHDAVYDHYVNNVIPNKVDSLRKDIYRIISDIKSKGKKSELLYKYKLSGLDYICIDGKMQVIDNACNRNILESINKKLSSFGYIRYYSRDIKNYKILTLILFLKE